MNPRPPENHQVSSCKFGGGREKGVRELRLGSDLMTTPNQYGAGGTSRIVSSGAVYNEMLRRRPDLLDVLYRPMHWDRQGDDDAGGQRWFELAPITDLDGAPRIFYIGWYIRDAQRHRRRAPAHRRAARGDGVARVDRQRPGFHVEMDFEPGDVQLLNNGRILARP